MTMTRLFLLRCLVLIAFLTGGSALANCNDEANLARLDNRPDEALRILQECLNEELSRVARSYLLLGLSWYDKGNQRQAIKAYSKAIETDPDYTTAWVNRGLSHALRGRYSKALADFETALQQDPANMQAFYFRAFAHEKEGRYRLAVEDYTRALDLADGDTEAATILHHRGLAYREMKNTEQALADYDRALSLNPAYVDAYFSRGLLYHKMDRTDAAIADYSRVIDLKPDHAEAFHNRGLLYQKTGTDHLAIRDYNQAIDLKPRYARAYVSRSYAYLIPVIPLLFVLLLG